MNALNILTHIGNTPPSSPPLSRAQSTDRLDRDRRSKQSAQTPPPNDAPAGALGSPVAEKEDTKNMRVRTAHGSSDDAAPPSAADASEDEKTPLLDHPDEPAPPFEEAQISKVWLLPKRISVAFIGSVKVILAAIAAPGSYLLALFYEEDGRFSFMAPVYRIGRLMRRKKRKAEPMRAPEISEKGKRPRSSRPKRPPASPASSNYAVTSDSELDSERPPTREVEVDSPSRHTRSKSVLSSTSAAGEEIAPAKRSIRIKLHSDEGMRQRKAKKISPRKPTVPGDPSEVSPEAAAALKSPIGTAAVASKQLTRFPRAPQPPRPLVPRRQPSYSSNGTTPLGPHQKTLIIDLDETLIHSMSKGGRYTTGHMVEVKLKDPMGAGGQVIGPQVPILYYVHKRPHCDEFLKKVQQRLPFPLPSSASRPKTEIYHCHFTEVLLI